jgi:hypothetical protein
MADGKGAAPAVVVITDALLEGGVGVVVDKGAEVVEARGGLGMFEAVTDIPLLLVDGLEGGNNAVFLSVEVSELLPGLAVVVEVGGQSSVRLGVGSLDEGVSVGGLGAEKLDEPGRQGREQPSVGVSGGGVDGAQVFFAVVRFAEGSDDVGGLPGAGAHVGGHVESSLFVSDGKVGGNVVIRDIAVWGLLRGTCRGVNLVLEAVDMPGHTAESGGRSPCGSPGQCWQGQWRSQWSWPD